MEVQNGRPAHGHKHAHEHAHAPGAGAAASPRDERVSQIISEFSEVFAFARSHWASYAQEVDSELKGVGMIVLQLVFRKGPVTATALSQMLDMDKAVVSRQIAKLRELGLVEAEASPEDRRVILLTATAHAGELLERIRRQWAHAYHERFADWSAEDLEQLRAGLHRFNASAHDIRIDGPAGRCTRGHGSED
ncbi:MarR family winged helix-turn-helix transcriptional regulator [Leucobacter tenebrionis]|uniref:MarR family winged helix-turn-helix transcriptional regulator n=1 Tax=Leucobacter tenebrionis TaxID=2873270 RepID=UPI001CA72F3D|nr:MarR family transcriptional regulator [Leucobacter tenebrionis]QZY51139.1 MarR family transcriptional regulator [Leucobacter tenebrionis]